MKISTYNQKQELVKHSIDIIRKDLAEVQDIFRSIIRESEAEDIFDFYSNYAMDAFPTNEDAYLYTGLMSISYRYSDTEYWFLDLIDERHHFTIKDIKRNLDRLSSSFTEDTYMSDSFDWAIRDILECDLETDVVHHDLIPYKICRETLDSFLLQIKTICIDELITQVEVSE